MDVAASYSIEPVKLSGDVAQVETLSAPRFSLIPPLISLRDLDPSSDPITARKNVPLNSLPDEVVAAADRLADQVSERLNHSGFNKSTILFEQFRARAGEIVGAVSNGEMTSVDQEAVIVLAAYLCTQESRHGMKFNKFPLAALDQRDGLDEIRRATLFHYLVSERLKDKITNAHELETFVLWHDAFRAHDLDLLRRFSVTQHIRGSSPGVTDGLNPIIRPWKIPGTEVWDLELLTRAVRYLCEFEVPRLSGTTPSLNGGAAPMFPISIARMFQEEMGRGEKQCNVPNPEAAFAITYPHLMGYQDGHRLPWDGRVPDKWKGQRGRALFRQLQAYRFSKHGLGSLTLDTTPPRFTLTRTDLSIFVRVKIGEGKTWNTWGDFLYAGCGFTGSGVVKNYSIRPHLEVLCGGVATLGKKDLTVEQLTEIIPAQGVIIEFVPLDPYRMAVHFMTQANSFVVDGKLDLEKLKQVEDIDVACRQISPHFLEGSRLSSVCDAIRQVYFREIKALGKEFDEFSLPHRAMWASPGVEKRLDDATRFIVPLLNLVGPRSRLRFDIETVMASHRRSLATHYSRFLGFSIQEADAAYNVIEKSLRRVFPQD